MSSWRNKLTTARETAHLKDLKEMRQRGRNADRSAVKSETGNKNKTKFLHMFKITEYIF